MKPILALNAYDPRASGAFDASLTERLRRREKLFGAASVLFYDRPLEFLRAEGCWLFDAAGAAYLDAYNNVPSVGHCHPRVVAAAARQLGTLNIHNRYLHETVLQLAERLLATLPTSLSNVTFACTGSESNDLALRLAREFTGGHGVIVTTAAYHGNTALVTDVSPSSYKRGGPPAHVRAIAPPDGTGLAAGELAVRFAARVTDAILDLERSGVRFSALLIDSIFSSDGIYADPPGFLRAAVDAVHRAGGVVIADEVQPGFGRTGTSLWGFERHGIEPDIVTMGKPMGNGYPIAALVTRPEILSAYCENVGYFNTFAGSPVAAAVASAVLDVIEEEDLMGNARRVGAHLQAKLSTLAARHAALGAVRGAGLYVGVDLRAGSVAAAAALTSAVINGMRERRVLIGAAGLHGTVLKLRPPLSFSIAHADQLLATLDEVLTAIEAAGDGPLPAPSPV
jgi:4-aminobutyrate aminotransferase-like enzyme